MSVDFLEIAARKILNVDETFRLLQARNIEGLEGIEVTLLKGDGRRLTKKQVKASAVTVLVIQSQLQAVWGQLPPAEAGGLK